MGTDSRDRVTVDLRGAGRVVQAKAMAQGITVAAFVRRAVMVIAEAPADSTVKYSAACSGDDQLLIKVTLRLTSAHALLLATRARSADVSQGSYVAGLLEGEPPPRAAPNRREAIAALTKSTDQLAVMSSDLQTVLRLLRTAAPERAEPFRGKVRTLLDDVRAHLDMASGYLADLQPMAPPGPRRRFFRRGS